MVYSVFNHTSRPISSKALFLDRDGIINVDHGYVYQAEKFEFMPGIFPMLSRAQSKGFALIVVTNQSGIARDYYTEQDLQRLSQWMKERFQQQGLVLLQVYFCPHHPNYGNEQYRQACDCRKPQAGMILQGIKDFNLDPQASLMLGDKLSDMQAAKAAGLARGFWLTSENAEEDLQKLDWPCQAISGLAELEGWLEVHG